MKVNQRKQRDFDEFESIDEVFELLKAKFANRKLYVRYSVDKVEVAINEFFDDGTMMIVMDPSYEADGIVSVYGLSDKYIELDLEIME